MKPKKISELVQYVSGGYVKDSVSYLASLVKTDNKRYIAYALRLTPDKNISDENEKKVALEKEANEIYAELAVELPKYKQSYNQLSELSEKEIIDYINSPEATKEGVQAIIASGAKITENIIVAAFKNSVQEAIDNKQMSIDNTSKHANALYDQQLQKKNNELNESIKERNSHKKFYQRKEKLFRNDVYKEPSYAESNNEKARDIYYQLHGNFAQTHNIRENQHLREQIAETRAKFPMSGKMKTTVEAKFKDAEIFAKETSRNLKMDYNSYCRDVAEKAVEEAASKSKKPMTQQEKKTLAETTTQILKTNKDLKKYREGLYELKGEEGQQYSYKKEGIKGNTKQLVSSVAVAINEDRDNSNRQELDSHKSLSSKAKQTAKDYAREEELSNKLKRFEDREGGTKGIKAKIGHAIDRLLHKDKKWEKELGEIKDRVDKFGIDASKKMDDRISHHTTLDNKKTTGRTFDR